VPSNRLPPPEENEETDNPLLADDRNYYKVQKWTKDGTKVDSLLYAGNNFSRAQHIFANALRHRPHIRLTIRQRTRGVAAVAGLMAPHTSKK
jgi:hypothetical protein